MTTLLPSALLGVQQPRLVSGPPFVSTAGDDAADLAAVCGLVLDPWQRLTLQCWLGEREDGSWAAFETGLLVARQNGKGAVLEALELAALFLFGEKLVLHSAHQFKTAREAFLRIQGLIENSDDLRRRCKKPRTSHGEEEIETLAGQRLRFVARSRSSGRGFTPDRVIFDEAQELSVSSVDALIPTMMAKLSPQVCFTGTVPTEENDSEKWVEVRDRGRASGGDDHLAWLEWTPPENPDLDSREVWSAANPALGYRITEESIVRARAALTEDGFAREILSVWSDLQNTGAIPTELWAGALDERSKVDAPYGFSIDIPPDQSHASIALAGVREDGRTHLEVVAHNRGTGWVVDHIKGLVERWKCKVAVDAGGPAGALIADLEQARIPLVTVSAREYAQACGAFYAGLAEDRIRHIGQVQLDVAAAGVRKRPLGDAWVWHRKNKQLDISPLIAVTLAGFALPPGQPRVSGRGRVIVFND